MHPVTFRKCLESKETLQSEHSVFCILHPSAGAPYVRCYGHTSQDPSLSSGILASDDSIAQLYGDRDKIEGRASAGHCDARDGHGIQGIEAKLSALSVVELKDRDSVRDDLSLRVSPVAEGLVLNEHQEGEGWVVDKAHIHLSNVIGFAANGERNDATRRYSGATFVEA